MPARRPPWARHQVPFAVCPGQEHTCSREPGGGRLVDLAGTAPADRDAWICASLVLAAGLLLFTVRGPRTQLSDDS